MYDIEKAKEFAEVKHSGQTDKSGHNYIEHPIRVASKLKDPKLKVVAMLHDTIEDTDTTAEEIAKLFGDDVADLVVTLSNHKTRPYNEFIQAVIDKGEDAIKVKIADIEDNLSAKRLGMLDKATQDKFKNKYSSALVQLKKALYGADSDTEFGDYIDKFVLNDVTESYEWGQNTIDEALKISHTNPNQPWSNPKMPVNKQGDIDTNAADAVLRKVYDEEAKPLVDKSKKELENLLKRYATAESKVIVGVKKFESFKNKVIGRGAGSKQVNRVHDMLRSALLLPDDKTTQRVVDRMKKELKLHEYETKEFGGDKKYGYYGSHHFKIVLSTGLIAEVQVMTRKLWTYKDLGHDVYNILRSPKTADQFSDAEKEQMTRTSKQIYKRGMGHGSPHIKMRKVEIKD